MLSEYGGGNTFAASSYLGWWTAYAQNPRVMDLERTATGTIADVATLTEIQDLGPVWLRLRLDITHRRLERLRMITAGHFMTQEWGSFNRALHVEPPPAAQVQRSHPVDLPRPPNAPAPLLCTLVCRAESRRDGSASRCSGCSRSSRRAAARAPPSRPG